MLKGPAEPQPLTLHPCSPLMLLWFGMLLMIVPRDNLPSAPKMNARPSKKGSAGNRPSHCKIESACLQVPTPFRLQEPPGWDLPWKNDFPIRRIVAADQDLPPLLLPVRQSGL